MKSRKDSKLLVRTYLKLTFTLILFALLLLSLNIRESKADYEVRIKEGTTLTYQITDCDDDLIRKYHITTVYGLEKGERALYKIYDIKKSNSHYIFRYRAWDWTDDENNFYQNYDSKNRLKTYIDPYFAGYPAVFVDRIHNNSEFMLSIILDNVDDYLAEVNWSSNIIQYGYWFIRDEGSYYVYHQYSKYGYLSEYSIERGDDIIFRARYDGELESPTNNELFFDLLPFIITTSGIIGITVIFGFIVKKKPDKKKKNKEKKEKQKIDKKKKYSIDYILEKEEMQGDI